MASLSRSYQGSALVTPAWLAVCIGVVFGASTLSGDSVVPISCTIAICAVVLRASATLKGIEDKQENHNERLTALEKTLKLSVGERRLDFDYLRAELAGLEQGPTGVRYRVLLVDDNPTDRFLFKRKPDEGFEVIDAETLAEANQKITGNDFDCVLLDLALPDSLPSQTVPTFLASNPGAIGLVLSGNENPKLATDALAAGADGFILKQVSDKRDANYLPRQIHLALARRRLKKSLGGWPNATQLTS